METAILVILIMPFICSAVLAGARRVADLNKGGQSLDDSAEKRLLALMLLPALLGIAVVISGHFAPVSLPLPRLDFGPGGEGGDASGLAVAGIASQEPLNWLHIAAQTTVILYVAGALLNATRLMVGFARIGHLVTRSHRDTRWGEGVRVTSKAISPLAWGRRTILLPQGLMATLPESQLHLILRHEREHLKRGDSGWFAVLAWVDAVFWFNPFVRLQTGRCRLAAELACDSAVLGAAPEMRGTYAETLLKVLRHAAGDVRQYAPTAFSPEKSGDYRMRISEIMHPGPVTRKLRWRLAALAAALIAPLGLVQFAWSQTAVSKAHDLTTAPIDSVITSGFGMRINPVTHKPLFHSGVDFKARTGTPVKAAGDGIVTQVYNEPDHMGKVIEIDHGSGLQTRYTHLDTQDVKVGDTVKASQQIATSGNSGVTTGPHMHFEVWKDGKPIDPATVLSLQKAS